MVTVKKNSVRIFGENFWLGCLSAFKRELAYSDRFAETQLKSNTVSLSDEIISKYLYV